MKPTVVIDCFPSSVDRYRSGYAIVAIDVIRATTMAITAVALGRRCFVADTLGAARSMASRLPHPLLSGELAGDMPSGFHMNNSPAQLSLRNDLHRPMVLLSSSGTKLMCNAARCASAVHLASFRNFTAVAREIAYRYERVAVIGAGSRSQFREEDQMCCAWVAEALIDRGYSAENAFTLEVTRQWHGAPPSACASGNSAAYLRRSNQSYDLDFILAHIDDLDGSYALQGDEVVTVGMREEEAIRQAA